MRKTLTDRGVAALKVRPKRYAFPDPELRRHWVRVHPSGTKSYVTVARGPDGKQQWATIGPTDAMSIDDAREKARSILERVRAGLPAIEPKIKVETFDDVAANWFQRHVQAKGLRSIRDIRRQLDAHILPEWKDRPFVSIRRSDVAALLDKVEDNHSARVADYTLSVVSGIMNWFAARADDYVPPLVKGMARRTKASRSRILDDDELRLVWRAAESYRGSAFSAIVRLCILTGQRSRKVAAMKWSDLQDGVWNIAREPREKDTGGTLALPGVALAIVESQPRWASSPYVFPARGRDGPFRGFGSSKAVLDAKLPKGTPNWTVHDLRRTARSLMSRAGVSSEHVERVMGHVIGGVEGVYDRHSYFDEKADALKKLAALIDAIVHPRPADVVPLRRPGRG
jgi:integrase